MAKPLELEDFAELAHLTRGSMVESRHLGVATLTSPTGEVLETHGNPAGLFYPRSALKPLQAIAMRRAGLRLTGAELAISAGSHLGTSAHVDLVNSILDSHSLTTKDLGCPRAWPGNPDARSKTASPAKEFMNCSGKHAAFLAACKVAGWSTADYLSPDHPLQLSVAQVIAEYTGENLLPPTTDGCGAPLFAVSSQGLARAIGKVAATEDELTTAMIEHAWAVGDHGNPDEFVLKHGFLAKIGAEGVFVIGTRSGFGVSVKIADGALRAAPAVALKLLLNQGLLSQEDFVEFCEKVSPKVLGGEKIIGELKVTI